MLWDGSTAIAPLHQPLPRGLVDIPLTDRQPGHLVLAWRTEPTTDVVGLFVDLATGTG